ncbi:arylsulfatase B-like [Haliotis rufescens]|uniref:arylsulfatase B-like n=1 Tax=Haliotis rufescens TaxID=6454 RepID=UPI00201F1E39|nr:arylsulfatase B-like [Haliotis rufescens]
MMSTTVAALLFAFIGGVLAQRPNIVFIVADDLGWNDVGFRNRDMLTPIMDKMARDGVILDRNYVQPLCSPSRSAFMSAVFPFKSGLQHQVIGAKQSVCLPLNYTILPQELKKLGYATHMVGKWHLGFCEWGCTPTYRGFDTFFGYYNSKEDYYLHNISGFLDFRNNKEAEWDYQGTYSAWVFTEKIVDVINTHDKSQPLFLYLPFQNVHAPTEVPKIYEDRFPHVVNKGRRVFSGMVNALDEAIGNVTDALKERGLYDNTLFLLTADNGGEIFSHGNNWPLRGGKHSLWEGGTRVTAFMSGAGLQKTGYTYDGMIHAVDWLPTLVSAAGGTPVTDRDGIDQWDSIRNGLPSKRTEFIYNLDYLVIPKEGQAGIRMGNYKLLLGYPGQQDGWHRPMNNTEDDIYEEIIYDLDPDKAQLFDVIADPTERHDLSSQLPDVVAKLKSRLLEYRKQMVPPNFPDPDPQSNPMKYGNAWTPGWCKL